MVDQLFWGWQCRWHFCYLLLTVCWRMLKLFPPLMPHWSMDSFLARVRVVLLRLQVPFAVLRPQSHGGALENLRQMHIMEQQITTYTVTTYNNRIQQASPTGPKVGIFFPRCRTIWGEGVVGLDGSRAALQHPDRGMTVGPEKGCLWRWCWGQHFLRKRALGHDENA